ncbi:acyl-CoA thioesterase [Bdellovibrionota bacterium FG-2]
MSNAASAGASYLLKILEKHLDTFGHVNNATYLELFEEARWEIITQGGFGLERIREVGLGPVILEANIRFHRELTLRQEVVVKTEFPAFEGKVGRITQWIEDAQGAKYCSAEFKYALFDLKLRKIVSPTPEWLASCAHLNT